MSISSTELPIESARSRSQLQSIANDVKQDFPNVNINIKSEGVGKFKVIFKGTAQNDSDLDDAFDAAYDFEARFLQALDKGPRWNPRAEQNFNF